MDGPAAVPGRGERFADAVLGRAGPLAAYAVVVVALAAAVLVPFGLWQPVVAVPVLAVGWALAWRLGREVPPSGADGSPRPAPGRGVVLPAALSLAVAAAFVAWAAATHAEHVVVRRDAGSYALFAQWLATRHGLPVEVSLPGFGGPAALAVPGFTFASPAFYEVAGGQGAQVVPQFLLGAPALLSLGWWAGGGWTGLLVVPALLGGLAVLAAAGLAARLAGPSWAPLAALALALAQPVVHAARSTYSEPAALLLVLAAASLAVDAVRAGAGAGGGAGPQTWTPAQVRARRLGLAAGLVLGLACLVRVDALREVALLLPVCAVLALRGSPAGVPMAVGAVAGAAVSAVPALLLSRPYLATIRGSVVPLVAATVVLAVLAAVAVAVGRRRTARSPALHDVPGGGGGVRTALPWLAAAVVGLLGLALATRPWWSLGRQSPTDPSAALVESLQRQEGLVPDGSRTYAEQTLRWTAAYLGWPAVVAAWATLAVLAARAVRWWQGGDRGRAAAWLAPAVVGLGSAVLTLYRPGITPDHPWADRRLVVTVLPLVVLAAVAGLAHVSRAAGRARPWATRAVAVAGGAVLLVPPALATLPVAGQRTEVGEPSAVSAVCAALSDGDVVVAVDVPPGGRAVNEWPQVVRGVCGRPAASLALPAGELRSSLQRLGELTSGAGSRLVLLAAPEATGRPSAPPAVLTGLGLQPRRAVRLESTEDQRLLTRLPSTHNELAVEVWTAPWPAPT